MKQHLPFWRRSARAKGMLSVERFFQRVGISGSRFWFWVSQLRCSTVLPQGRPSGTKFFGLYFISYDKPSVIFGLNSISVEKKDAVASILFQSFGVLIRIKIFC